jgi:hypothetical protein
LPPLWFLARTRTAAAAVVAVAAAAADKGESEKSDCSETCQISAAANVPSSRHLHMLSASTANGLGADGPTSA